MRKNSNEFSLEDAMEFAKSPKGQQLLSILKSTDGALLQTAMQQAANGNLEQAKNTLSGMGEYQKIQEILKSKEPKNG